MDEKVAVQSQTMDEKMDSFLDKATTPEEVTAPESSEQATIPETTDTPAEVSKDTEPVDEGKEIEEKLAKVREILGDDKAVDAYIKSKGYHKDPAWQKLMEKVKNPAIPPEMGKEIETVKQIVSDPEFIRFRMQKQGYKDEAIDSYLRDKGFKIPERQEDDVALVTRMLGVKPDDIPNENRPIISDIAKIARIMAKAEAERMIEERLGPVSQKVDSVYSRNFAQETMDAMKTKVTSDGDLDFDKDVAPHLSEYLEKNPEATINQVHTHFKEIYPELRVKKIKLSLNNQGRAKAKETIATSGKTPIASGRAPEKTGDKDRDMDAFFDYIGYKE